MKLDNDFLEVVKDDIIYRSTNSHSSGCLPHIDCLTYGKSVLF